MARRSNVGAALGFGPSALLVKVVGPDIFVPLLRPSIRRETRQAKSKELGDEVEKIPAPLALVCLCAPTNGVRNDQQTLPTGSFSMETQMAYKVLPNSYYLPTNKEA